MDQCTYWTCFLMLMYTWWTLQGGVGAPMHHTKYPNFVANPGVASGGHGNSNPPGLVRIQPKPGQLTTPPPYHRMPPHLAQTRQPNDVNPSVSSSTHPIGLDTRYTCPMFNCSCANVINVHRIFLSAISNLFGVWTETLKFMAYVILSGPWLRC